MTQEKLVDYQEEAKNIGEYTGDWFKAHSGNYTIEFLNEPVPVEKEIRGEQVKQIECEIKVNEKKFNWSITKGKTYRSLYGQLMLIGQNKGKLKGEKINLIVKGSGQDIDYTVVEAVELIPTEQPRE